MRQKVIFFLLLTLALAIPSTGSQLFAQNYIKIDSYSKEKFNLALYPLYDQSRPQSAKTRITIENRIKWALDFTGLFKRIDPASYLEKPMANGWLRKNTNFSDWMVLDVLGLIKGWYKLDGTKITIELLLFDVFLQKEIWQNKKTVKLENLEKTIDSFISEILKVLTGQPGIFDKKIAFLRKVKYRGKKWPVKELFITEMSGQKVQKKTFNQRTVLSPSWQKDNRAIVVSHFPPSGQSTPYLLNLTNNRFERIGHFSELVASPSFSPKKNIIAVSMATPGDSAEDIFIINKAGKKIKRITRALGSDTSPSFSGDGKKLVFSSNRSGRNQLYTVASDGGRATRLTFVVSECVKPAWSPNSDLIAFAAQDRRKHGGKWNIFTIRADGSQIKRLTWQNGHNEQPSFSPDGQYIFFSSTRRGQYEIYMMRSDGSNQRPLSRTGVRGEMPAVSN